MHAVNVVEVHLLGVELDIAFNLFHGPVEEETGDRTLCVLRLIAWTAVADKCELLCLLICVTS